MRKRPLLLCLLAVLFASISYAQSRLSINAITPAEITPCGGVGSYRVDIINTSQDTLIDVQLTVTMPQGIDYVSGGNLFSLPSPNMPVFSFPDSTKPNDTLSVEFTANAGCGAIDEVLSGAIIQNHNQVDYTCTCDSLAYMEQSTTGFYDLIYPDLVISRISPQPFFANLGDTLFQRTITILNGGLGAVDSFFFSNIQSSDVQTLYYVIGGDTIFGTDTLALDTVLQYGDSLQIFQTLRIDSCNEADSEFSVGWGCGDTCDMYTDYARVLMNIGQPQISVNRTLYTGANYCGRDAWATWQFINGGAELDTLAGIATNIKVIVRYTQDISELDSFQINGTLIPDSLITTDTAGSWLIDLTRLTVDLDGAGGLSDINGDGFYSELAVSDSFSLTMKMHLNCDSVQFANECPLGYSQLYAQPHINYNNMCYLLADSATQDSLEAFTDPFVSSGQSLGAQTDFDCLTQDNGPADVMFGDTATFSFCIDGVKGGDLTCPNGFYRIRIALPDSIGADTSLAAFSAGPVDSVYFVPTGDTVIIEQNTTMNGCYFLGFFFDESCPHQNLDIFELPYVINWEVQYFCERDCDCVQRLGCDQIEFFEHFDDEQTDCFQNNCPNRSLLTTSMDVNRISYGWTNSSLTTSITPGPNTNLNAAYACDTIQVEAKGIVANGNNVSEPHIRIEYVAPVGIDTVLKFANTVSIELYDANPFPTSFNCPTLISPIITSQGLGPITYYFDFDISPCLSGIIGGVLDNEDSINLVVNFIVNPNLNSPPTQIFEIPRFRTTHYSVTNQDTFNTCGSRGHRYDLYKPTNSFASDPVGSQCDPVTVSLDWYYNQCSDEMSNADDFDFEFRHLGQMEDTIIVTIPPGYEFVSGTGRYVTDGSALYPSETQTATLVNSTGFIDSGFVLTFIPALPDTAWPVQDKSANTWLQHFRLDLQPTCQAPERSEILYDFKWTDFAYSMDTNCMVLHHDSVYGVIYNDKPDLNITPLNGTVLALSDTFSFGVRLCNETFSADALYTWIALENSSGNLAFHTALNETTGDTLTLDTINNNLGVWVKTDTLNTINCNTITFKGTYDSCRLDTIALTASWSCTGYITDPDSNSCPAVIDTLLFLVEPANSNLQATLDVPAQITLCDTTDTLNYYTFTVNASDAGTIYDIVMNMCLDSGLYVVNNSSQLNYPYINGSWVSIPNPTVSTSGNQNCYEWAMDTTVNQMIGESGLPGVGSFPNNTFQLRFRVIAECGIPLGSLHLVDAWVTGETSCRDTFRLNFETSPQEIAQPQPAYFYIHSLDPDTINLCHDTTNINSYVINFDNDDTTGFDDTVCIFLPVGIEYLPGSFVDVNGLFANTTPTVNGRNWCWPLPGGIAPKDSIPFRFQVYTTASFNCQAVNLGISTTRFDSVYCPNSGSTCVFDTVTTQNFQPIVMDKPRLVLSNLTPADTLFCGPGLDSVTLTITNNGQPVLSGDVTTIEFWCDDDNNGFVSGGDILLTTITLTSAIPTGSSINVGANIPANCGYNRALIAYLPVLDNCACNISQTLFTPLDALFSATNVCLGDTLCPENLSDTTLATSWQWDFGTTNATVIPSDTAQSPCVVYDTTGVFTITLIATDACGSDTFDIDISVGENPVADAGEDTTVCDGQSVTLGGNPTATGGNGPFTFGWFPVGGLSSATAPNPVAVINGSSTTWSVLVTDSIGCTDTDTVRVNLLQNPVTVNKSVDAQNAYPGQTLTYTIDVCNQNSVDATFLLSDQFNLLPWPTLCTPVSTLPSSVFVPGDSCVTLSYSIQLCMSDTIRGSNVTNCVTVTDTLCGATDQSCVTIPVLIDCPFQYTSNSGGNVMASCPAPFDVCLNTVTDDFAFDSTGLLIEGMQYCISYPDSLMRPVQPFTITFNSNITGQTITDTTITLSNTHSFDNRSQLTFEFNSNAFDLRQGDVVACIPFELVCGADTGSYENILIECNRIRMDRDNNTSINSFVDNGHLEITQGCDAASDIADASFSWIPDPICLPTDSTDIVTFYASDTTGSDVWIVNGTGFLGTADTALYPIALPGTFTMLHSVSTACGTDTVIDTITINSPPVVEITASSNATLCDGQCVQLTISSLTPAQFSAGSAIWTTGDTTQTITVCAGGEYGVTFTDASGCTASEVYGVGSSPKLPPTANAGTDTTISCGDSVLIGSAAVPAHSYAWIPIEQLTDDTAAKTTAYPTQSTLYVHTLTDDSTGCQDTDSVLITVLEPSFSGCSFTEPDTAWICPGDSCVKIGCNLTPLCHSPAYSWAIFNGQTSTNTGDTTQTLCAAPDSITTYIQTIRCVGSSCVQRDTFVVIPEVILSCVAVYDTTTGKLCMYAKADGGSGSFKFDFRDHLGNVTNTLDSVVCDSPTTVSQGDTFMVRLTDQLSGCVYTCSDTIILTYNTNPPAGFKQQTEPVQQSSIKDATVQVYPNPFQGSLNFAFTLEDTRQVRIQVYDLHGRLAGELSPGQLEAGRHTLVWDAAGKQLPDGMYIARILMGEKVEVVRVMQFRP